MPDLRLPDFMQDLMLVREIYKRLLPKFGNKFTISDVIKLIKKNYYLTRINEDCIEKKLKTILIGFGNFASGHPEDPRMQKYFRYCSHAEILSSHKNYEWRQLVEPNNKRRNLAKKWKVPIVVDNVKNLPANYFVDVAIISSPPDTRLKVLESINVKKGLH